jgi:hypothetical protein
VFFTAAMAAPGIFGQTGGSGGKERFSRQQWRHLGFSAKPAALAVGMAFSGGNGGTWRLRPLPCQTGRQRRQRRRWYLSPKFFIAYFVR